jgi:Zn-dependent M16 (insulinase) family peptidase
MNASRPSFLMTMLACFSLLFSGFPAALAQDEDRNAALDNLVAGKTINGFRTATLYTNDVDQVIGGRLVHARTGFVLDYLQIQSVPQGFVWVNSYPTSDMGEPHTQEHLLLGKGNVGRAVASLENMSLASSSAFTEQWRTSYHFHTAAGPEVFYQLFERKVDALVHPDYTDEEIRREVRNFGVTENPSDKSLRLEEKGTVYNEMVSSFDRPAYRLYRAIDQALYGNSHPLSYSSGGLPSSIRQMKAEDIRKFHRDNYHLGNMGMIGSFPKEMPLAELLTKLDGILNRLEPNAGGRKFMTEAELPAPQAAQTGKIQIVDYPQRNDQQPGSMVFVWPATLKLDTREIVLCELFLANLAGDATTNLYKRFVDTKTREIETGAKSVFGFISDELGQPVYIGLNDVAPANMTEEKIALVRAKVLEELKRVASWKDNSPELAEFNARLKNRVIQERRSLSKFVNSPPGFGFRGTSAAWISHIYRLSKSNDFRKSVTMKPELDFVLNLLASNQNFWRDYLAKWKLTEKTPYAAAARPSPDLVKQEENDRVARSIAEVARLKAKYGVADEQEAIRRYKAEYDAETVALEKLAKQSDGARFIESPPLSLDDQLDYKVQTLSGGVPLVASTFDNMTSATTGLALRLDGVAEDELVYLSLLPALLTRVGVIKDGKPVSFEEMSELLRQEILGLNAYFSTNFTTERTELVVRGAGNDAMEAQKSVEWMKLILQSPDWRPENLARIRDVVDQTLSSLRNRMQGSEESWVNNPADAYWRQDNPLLLASASFLTQMHNAHRLRWMLKHVGTNETRDAINAFLTRLASAGTQGNRTELKVLLAAMQGDKDSAAKLSERLKSYNDEFARLPEAAKSLAGDAAKDIDQTLADIPDSSLAADWSYLSNQIRQDLLVSPGKTLADLNRLRQRLLKTGNARLFVIGSRATQEKLQANLRDLLAGLQLTKAETAKHSGTKLIDARLRERTPEATTPIFVGLVNPNSQSGVFLNSAPSASFKDTDTEKLLEFLSSRLYAGGGAHGIFIKTWGAGLAYSNGFRGSPAAGRMGYYAERTPELPQTLRFVIEELKKAPRDPNLVEYAIAQAFLGFRSASEYEARGEAMAADLADGMTPEVVSRFRRQILELRRKPNLADELYKRMEQTYAKVLPGYGVKAKTVEDGIFFVIGPEKQFGLYEDYLKSVEGADTRVYRLYPRDFWMPMNAGGVTTSSALTEDEQHRLFQAAGITHEPALILEMTRKLGLTDSGNQPTPAFEPFVKAHYEWFQKNTEFVREHMSKEKALEYVMTHK